MNEVESAKILCPFYVTHNCGHRNNTTITCENIETHMGFNVNNKLFFQDRGERKDYMEIFCMDQYASCPYYKAIYKKHEKESKHGNR